MKPDGISPLVVQHRLLLQHCDCNNAERFVIAVEDEDGDYGVYGQTPESQIQWLANFWVEQIGRTGAINAMTWHPLMRACKDTAAMEAVFIEHLLPVIENLNLPRL